jgi:glycosyltransferase involved in cell wall biosynthesis
VSLLEAMSSGLFPVVTDVGGNAEVLGAELRHGLVAPASAGALAEAWRSSLADRQRLRRHGILARQRVLANYDVRTMVHGYEHLYGE